ncbi:MAG: PKD domain-containing protein [Candidatus Bathyarchaeia archaeon]
MVCTFLFLKVEGYDPANALFAHAETTVIGNSLYYAFKPFSADGPAVNLSNSAATTGRKLMGRLVYSLFNVKSISVSTWTVTYRVMKSASALYVVAHCDVDILIRKSDGAIRTVIAMDVANSPNINPSNTWVTLTGTYEFPGYTVVDQTDYLEVDFYIEVTTPQNSKSVKLLVDDPTLPLADQTKIEGAVFVLSNQPPVASFTYHPTDPLIYEIVTFDASASYDLDGSIVSYTWDFGDGNVTTVTDPIITHVYTTAASTVNYTVTLTVTDNEGLTGSTSQIVPVTNPTILRVSLPAGKYVGPNPNQWLSQCWLLDITGVSGSFTVRVSNMYSSIESFDTHLIIAINNLAYENLQSLTVNDVSIPKSSFIYGTPEPYGFQIEWEEDVYPTWFSTALVGNISASSYVEASISIAFTDPTGVKVHFDAFGIAKYPTPPKNKGHVTHNPHNGDSTVQFSPAPITKYYLDVEIDPEGVTTIYGEGWYDEGTKVTLAAPDIVQVSLGMRYKFSYWDVDGKTQGTGINTITVIMNANHVATAHYIMEYYLTVISPFGRVGGEGWYQSGATAYATLNTGLVDHGNGTRRVFVSWSGDASGTNYALSGPITMNAPKIAIANWKTQYLLTVVTDPVGISPQPTRNPAGEAERLNSWWYDADTPVTLTAQTVAGYNFNYWDVNGASLGGGINPITVVVNAPKTATAHYAAAPPSLTVSISPMSAIILIGQQVTFTSTVSGGTAPYTYQWYVNNQLIPGATSSSFLFSPTATGIYYVMLKVTDAADNTAQSDSARVTVLSVPVGGYSAPLTKNTPITPTIVYAMLIALFSALLSLKRKVK